MAKHRTCISEETMIKLKASFAKDVEVMEELNKVGACKQRKLSAYQQFVGVCLKAGGNIKDCAAKWREQKGK